MGFPSKDTLDRIYGSKAQEAQIRYRHLQEGYQKQFHNMPESYFSAPGRTEMIGNHTDHNGGKILAGSITLDTICAAGRTDDHRITICSEGYPLIKVDLNAIDKVPHCKGSTSLIAGMVEGARKKGYQVGGFNAYMTTQVISSAGVSSSASFEMLIMAVINAFYNDGKIDYPDYARIGQYGENHFWDKASGLMDQMACAVGGAILLDFHEGVQFEKVHFSFGEIGYDEIIINTGKGHADLAAEYSSIPNEMRAVAHYFGKNNLCEISEQDLLDNLNDVRKAVENDRAIMRALHFFEENRRVEMAEEVLKAGHPEEMIALFNEGGDSSWEWLQNCYVASNPKEQSIPLALALTRIFINRIGRGAERLHGGGFAGVIEAIIPQEYTDEYVHYMTPYFGAKNIYVMGIRQTGAVEVQ